MVINGPLSEKNARHKDEVELSSDEDERKPRMVYRHEAGTVELHLASLECLEDEGCYLKDNIIQFYYTYLLNTICEKATRERVRIFDSIFYEQLSKVFSKNKVDGNRFKQVRKWYCGQNLFEKDFIVFPICHSDHWYAMVACYPRNVADFPPAAEEVPIAGDKSPALIVLCSLRLNHRGHPENIMDFLDFEWRAQCSNVKRFSHNDMPIYVARLPKQNNSSNCGLYLLAYIECFLQDPDRFYKAAIEKRKDNKLCMKIEKITKENTRDTIRNTIKKVCDHIR